MSLYESWKRMAYNPQGEAVRPVWDAYLDLEQGVYETILREKCTHIEGTVEALGERFGLSTVQACAFLDGIHEAVDGLPPMDELEADTMVTLDIEFTRLFGKMVEYKAEALYKLPEWNAIFTPEEQKQLYTEQKRAHTVVRSGVKIGRNDPCPCGSGKKYKKCCGAA